MKWFDPERGWGFLTIDDGGQYHGRDIFVHVTEVEKLNLAMLQKGDQYAFKLNSRHKDGKFFAIELREIK